MADGQKNSDPVITIKLQKGLADRNRLPLADFLGVLEEFRQMMSLVGKRLQRERGFPSPTGDFGLEIVAGELGISVQPGSVWSPLAITANADVGVLAAQEVIRNLNQLEEEQGIPDPNHPIDRDLVRRIFRVARIQKRDKLELEVSVQRPGYPDSMKATFGSGGMASLKALQTSTFEVEGVSVYGKLTELLDRDPSDEDGKGFWGELRGNNGEAWRVQFKTKDAESVTALFRKQVVVTGTAMYYRVTTPKIIPTSIAADPDRDFVAAFDEIVGRYKGSITPEMIRDFRDGD